MNYLGQYSIKELEKLSGVRAHTIRIWEQRYKLLKPKRTSTNIRFYDDEQLKHLLNVSLLLKNGLKISAISELTPALVKRKLSDIFMSQKGEGLNEDKVNGLIVSMIDLDEALFEKIFSASVLRLGLETTILSVIYPFLARVGLMWTVGEVNPAQEHFISNLIRQKIIAAIDGQALAARSNKKYLLFMPEGELHEIGLLMASYLIRANGSQSIYLGQNVPMNDVEKTYHLAKPEVLVTFITASQSEKMLNEYLKWLSGKFKKATIFISGSPEVIAPLQIPSNIKWIKSIPDFKSKL